MNHCHHERRKCATALRRGQGVLAPAWADRLWGVAAVLACLSLCIPLALGQPKMAFARGGLVMLRPGGMASGVAPGGIVPLVNADDEYARYLRKAERLIKDGHFAPAIELLQAFIRKRDSGVVASGDGRQFVSLWLTANRLIGTMPAKGLRRYRTLFDPPAQQLYRQAVASSDTAALRRVVHDYLHSSYGAKALDALGTIYFDRGRFFRAARSWRQGLEVAPQRTDKPLVLAKIATAYHLAGDAEAADEVVRKIKADHAGATAVLGGKKQSIAAFLARVQTMKPVGRTAQGAGRTTWSGLAGAADGMTVMDVSDVVLMPRWRKPLLLENPSLPGDLVVLKHDLTPSYQMHYSSSTRMTTSASLRDGHIDVVTMRSNRRSAFVCPPALYPVISGELIVCRTDKAVMAYEAFTGEEKWHSEAFPMYRDMSGISIRSYSYGYGTKVGDRGWNTVTVADGKVFAIGNFRPSLSSNQLNAALRQYANDKKRAALLADTSNLTAMSLKGGKRLWEIGHLAGGNDEILRSCKFISLPTYYRGQLYVMAMYLESYYVICLDASNGRVVWKASVSQAPAINMRSGYFSYLLERGSGPAVADGQVFALTNAGVVAAFDAETGQTLWAHQYPSRSAQGLSSYPGSTTTSVFNPANPVIVCRGQVICLPADSTNVLALSVDDGSLSWEADRKGQRYLSSIDDRRVLLSAPGQLVLATARRAAVRKLYPAGNVDNKGIVGRPAVTPIEAVSSGRGRLWRLNLADYHTETADLGHPGGLLGNLVSTEGKLIAANALGLCAYFNYDHARQRLSQQIAQALGSQKPKLVFKRAQLAFNAKRFGDARDDLLRCSQLAETENDQQLPFSIRPWLYRVYVALGNRAKTLPEMLAMFRQARDYGETAQEKAHMLLRLAKYHERAGSLAQAVSLAQELGEKYAAEELVDVKIGPEADDMVRFGSDRNRIRGKQLAQGFVERLIELNGRELYTQFDGRAAKALAEARKLNDPEAMEAVARRWEHSASADDALMAAAEAYYKRALPLHEESKKLDARAKKLGPEGRDLAEQAAAKAKEAETSYSRAVQYLAEVANRSDSDLRLKANVAVAVIYARRGYDTTAAITCDETRRLCKQNKSWSLDAQITFGEISGTVESILKSVESGKLPTPVVRRKDVSAISLPLRKIFTVADPSAQILRDQYFHPVRMGQYIFVVKGKDVLLFDTLAANAEAAVRWSGLTTADPAEQEKYYSYPPGWRMVGALSGDNKVLVIADRKSVTGLDVQSGKVAWRKALSDIGIPKFGSISVGSGVMVLAGQGGSLTCLDIATGAERWRASLGGQFQYISGSPQIGAGVVLTTNSKGREITCHSVRTGKLLARWTASRYAQAAVSNRGFIVLMIDGTLSVREIDRLARPPIWTCKYAENRQVGGKAVEDFAAILRVSDDRIVVSPGQATNKIEVRSLTAAGQIMARIETSEVGGRPGLPADAWFDNGHLYVACSMVSIGRRKQAYGLFSSAQGLSIQKFSLDGAKDSTRAIWSRDLDIDPDPRNKGQVVPLTVTASHVVAFVKHYQTTRPIEAFVLDVRTGKTLEKIDLVSGVQDVTARTKRQGMIGPPVMTNGRLCVETCEGITVYGGQ